MDRRVDEVGRISDKFLLVVLLLLLVVVQLVILALVRNFSSPTQTSLKEGLFILQIHDRWTMSTSNTTMSLCQY